MAARRKNILMICIAVLVCVFSVPSLAAQQEVAIDELKIALSFPDRYDVFTRDIDESSPLFEKYGLDPQTLAQAMEESNHYVDAVNTGTGNQIIVSGYSDELSEELWSLTNSDPADFIDETEKARQLLEPGADISVRQRGGVHYWYYTLQSDDGDVAQYTTIENGLYIQLTAQSPAGRLLTENDLLSLDETAGSLQFTEVVPKPAATGPVNPMEAQDVFFYVMIAVIAYMGFRLVMRIRKTRREALEAQERIPPPPVVEELKPSKKPEVMTKGPAAFKYHHLTPPKRDRSRDSRTGGGE